MWLHLGRLGERGDREASAEYHFVPTGIIYSVCMLFLFKKNKLLISGFTVAESQFEILAEH